MFVAFERYERSLDAGCKLEDHEVGTAPVSRRATVQTSPGGAGRVHILFGATSPFISDGSLLDLRFRVVDALPRATSTIDLRTDCFTLQIK